MTTPVITKPITLADLQAVDGLDEYKGMEVVGGVWTPKHREGGVSVGNGRIGVRLIRLLGDYVEETRVGEIYMPETIFIMDVDDEKVQTMRKPDIAFVQASRVNPDDFAYYHVAPDLVVEVLSPSDTPAVIYGKLTDYFTYGTGQVWLVYPREKKIAVHFPDGTATTYESGATLSGGDLLPGFTLDVAWVFQPPLSDDDE